MVKKQQMRWNRFTVQPSLTVRVHVLNGTLEQLFRDWHMGFRPSIAAGAPHTFSWSRQQIARKETPRRRAPTLIYFMLAPP